MITFIAGSGMFSALPVINQFFISEMHNKVKLDKAANQLPTVVVIWCRSKKSKYSCG